MRNIYQCILAIRKLYYLCLLVRIPGWKKVDNCTQSTVGNTMQCLRYKRNADMATDVNCIVLCEGEKAKSTREIKTLHRHARVRTF